MFYFNGSHFVSSWLRTARVHRAGRRYAKRMARHRWARPEEGKPRQRAIALLLDRSARRSTLSCLLGPGACASPTLEPARSHAASVDTLIVRQRFSVHIHRRHAAPSRSQTPVKAAQFYYCSTDLLTFYCTYCILTSFHMYSNLAPLLHCLRENKRSFVCLFVF